MSWVAWVDIGDSEIAVDAKILAQTFRRLVQRTDNLKARLDAEPVAERIPAQALPNQTAGSGLGIKVSQTCWRVYYTPAAQVVGAGSVVDYDTGVPYAAGGYIPHQPVVRPSAGVNYDLWPTIRVKDGSANYFLRVQNFGSGAATFTGAAWFIGE